MGNQQLFLKGFVKIATAIIILVVFIAVFVAFFNQPKNKNSFDLSHRTAKIAIVGTTLKVDVSDTDSLRIKGLSDREKLTDNEGMWFIFDTDSKWGFWMQEMKFPLDVIWFDKNLKIISIQKNLSPESYPEVFYPEEKARYTLEVNAGFSEKHKIKIGDQAEITSL